MIEKILVWPASVIGFIAGRWIYKKYLNKAQEKIRFIEKAEKDGNCTQAVAVEKTFHYGDRSSNDIELRSPSIAVSYEFQIHGEVFYKTLMFQRPGKALIEYPEKLMIYYDPRKPKKSICKEELGFHMKPSKRIYPALGWGVLVMVGTYYLLLFLFG